MSGEAWGRREPYRLLDLFSGIGGFSLGLERTGGFKTVAFCEIDPRCQRILAHHWPEVTCHADVTTLAEEDVGAVDIITGGFPCQDISFAGAGEGINGARSGLWREFARLIGELRPSYVIVENVAALLDRGLGRVLGDLAALGYDAEWDCIPASAVGAPHRRDRLWIVAYPVAGHGGAHPAILPRRHPARTSGDALPWSETWQARVSAVSRMDDGLSDRLDKAASNTLGNAVVPQIPELIGRAILRAEAA